MKINSIIGDAGEMEVVGDVTVGGADEMEVAGDDTDAAIDEVGGGDETEDKKEDVQNRFPFINPNPKLRKNDVDFYASVIWSQRYNKNILDYLLKPISTSIKSKLNQQEKTQMNQLLTEIWKKYNEVEITYRSNEDGLMQHFSKYCFESAEMTEEDKKLKYSIFVAFKENNYNLEQVQKLIEENLIIILNDPMANEKSRENPQTSISWGLPFTKDDSDSQFSLELYGNLYKIFRGIDEDGYIPTPPNQTLWTTTRVARIGIFYKYFWKYFLPVLTELENTLPEHQFDNPLLKKVLLFVWYLPKTDKVHKDFELKTNDETNVIEDVLNFPIFKRMGLNENLGSYTRALPAMLPRAIFPTDELEKKMISQINLICKVIAKGFFEFINQLILCACNFNPEPLHGLVWQENTENTETDPDKKIIINENLIPDEPGNFFRIPWSAYRTMPFKYHSKPDIKVTQLVEDNFVLIHGLNGSERKFFAIDPQRGNISRYLQAYNRVLNNMQAIFVLKEKQKGTKTDSLFLNLSELKIKNDDAKDHLSRQISEKLKESITPKLANSYKYACDDFVQKFSLKRNKGAEEYEKLVKDDDDEVEQITAPVDAVMVVDEQQNMEEEDKSDGDGMKVEKVEEPDGDGMKPEEDEMEVEGPANDNGKRGHGGGRDPENGGNGNGAEGGERPGERKKKQKLNASKKWKKIKNYLLDLKF